MEPRSKKRRRPDDGQPPKTLKSAAPLGVPQHPFAVDYCDHFETPLNAYRDIRPLLLHVAACLGKSPAALKLWDPYFCAGRAATHLKSLGFKSVLHKNEDFYAVLRENRIPNYDCLITNPPYSGDHKRRCFEFCVESGKPWLLLLPAYVATKGYFREVCLETRTSVGAAGSSSGGGGGGSSGSSSMNAKKRKPQSPAAAAGAAAAAAAAAAAGASAKRAPTVAVLPASQPCYVVPRTRYAFDHPEGTGHPSSPFEGVWFVQLGAAAAGRAWEALLSGWQRNHQGSSRLVRSLDELAVAGVVNTDKRPNPRQRKRAKVGAATASIVDRGSA